MILLEYNAIIHNCVYIEFINRFTIIISINRIVNRVKINKNYYYINKSLMY